MAKVVSINISEKKGVIKVPVQCAELKIKSWDSWRCTCRKLASSDKLTWKRKHR